MAMDHDTLEHVNNYVTDKEQVVCTTSSSYDCPWRDEQKTKRMYKGANGEFCLPTLDSSLQSTRGF